MPKRPLVALMYDFDKTLSPRDMQEYSFIPALNMEASDFWDKCAVLTKKHNMDQILSYMFVMLQEAEKSGMYLNKNEFRNLGKAVQLFDGVETWFERINQYGESVGLQVEHYILSSGLKEIIEATKIAKEFKKIYASEYCYNEYEEPIWPAMAVNYTSKTQFLFRINKGVLEVTENDELNASMAEENKRISFKNMIYIGDGFTDVPCMKLVKSNGGHSIAVYQNNAKEVANNMILNNRVDFVLPTDYTEGSLLQSAVCAILDEIRSDENIQAIHMAHVKAAQDEIDQR